MAGDPEFRKLLAEGWPELSDTAQEAVERFHELVIQENEVQNLTRLVSPEDFFQGHVVDVQVLLKCGWIQDLALDLGSGAGVPGLLAALLSETRWILAESEVRKAAFLARAAQELGLSERVQVYSGRAEQYLRTNRVGSVVARAVGPVSRIYGWIRECSTWNTMILFKGPSWEQEWAEFRKSSQGKELKLSRTHPYEVGTVEKKSRILVELVRTSR